jgi:hypothetical protein
MRGWATVWQGIQQQSITEKQDLYYGARALFERALAIDPNYADALAGDAFVYMADYLYGWSPAGTDYEEKIIGQANRVIALAPDDPRGYNPKSLFLRMTHRENESIQVANDGLATNPTLRSSTPLEAKPRWSLAVLTRRYPMPNRRSG